MRKTSLLLLFGLLIFLNSFSQSYIHLVKQADSLYNSKNYKAACDSAEKAFKLGDTNYNDLYNGACYAALAKKQQQALKWLNLSINKGWTDLEHLKIDNDLISLHNDTAWTGIIERLKKANDAIEANYDKPLMAELKQILYDDQKPRTEIINAAKKLGGYNNPTTDSLNKIVMHYDSINVNKVITILDTKGWPAKGKVNYMGQQTLFLVIQHANIEVQKKYLPVLQQAVKDGTLDKASFALLTDRMALREGKKQIYGSQIGFKNNPTVYYVLPLEDPDNVDKRRATMGLGPLADYVSQWNITWNAEEYKKQLPQIEQWHKDAGK